MTANSPDAWRKIAACRGHDTNMWFPARGAAHTPETLRAHAICSTCPVRQPCLDEAVNNCEPFGIRGGATPHRRRIIRRNRQTTQDPTTNTTQEQTMTNPIPDPFDDIDADLHDIAAEESTALGRQLADLIRLAADGDEDAEHYLVGALGEHLAMHAEREDPDGQPLDRTVFVHARYWATAYDIAAAARHVHHDDDQAVAAALGLLRRWAVASHLSGTG